MLLPAFGELKYCGKDTSSISKFLFTFSPVVIRHHLHLRLVSWFFKNFQYFSFVHAVEKQFGKVFHSIITAFMPSYLWAKVTTFLPVSLLCWELEYVTLLLRV